MPGRRIRYVITMRKLKQSESVETQNTGQHTAATGRRMEVGGLVDVMISLPGRQHARGDAR